MNAKKVHISRPLHRRLNQVLQLLGYGWTEQEIAKRLGIGVGTARTYLDQLRRILPVSSRADVRRLARDWSAGKVRIYAEIKRERF